MKYLMSFNIVFYSKQINLVSFFFHKNYSYFYLMHTYLLFWSTFSTLKFRKKGFRKKKPFKYYKNKKCRVKLLLNKSKFLKQPLESFFLPKRTNHNFFMNSYGKSRPSPLTKSFGVKVTKIIKKRQRFKSTSLFKNFFLPKFNVKNRKNLFLFLKLTDCVLPTSYGGCSEPTGAYPNLSPNSKGFMRIISKFFLKPKLFSFKKKRKKYRKPILFRYKVKWSKWENRLTKYALSTVKSPFSIVTNNPVLRYRLMKYRIFSTRFTRYKSRKLKKKRRVALRVIRSVKKLKKKRRMLLKSRVRIHKFRIKLTRLTYVVRANTYSGWNVRNSKTLKTLKPRKSFTKLNNTLLSLQILNSLPYRYTRGFKKFIRTTRKRLLRRKLGSRLRSVRYSWANKRKLNKKRWRNKKRRRNRLFAFLRKKARVKTLVRRLQILGIFSKTSSYNSLPNNLSQVTNTYLPLFAIPFSTMLSKSKLKKIMSLNQAKFPTLFSFFCSKHIKQKWFFISKHLFLSKGSINAKFLRKKQTLVTQSWIFSKYGHPFILHSTGLKFYRRFKFKFKKPISNKILKSYYSFLKFNELKKFTFDYVKKRFFGSFKRRLIFSPTILRGILKNINYFSFFKNFNFSKFTTINTPKPLVNTEVFSFSDIDNSYFTETLCPQHQRRELYIPRVKFKPGYMRIWRHFRLAFAEALNFKYIYQQQLTKHLSRFSRRINQHYFQFWENNIVYMFIYSQLIPDNSTFNLFLSNHFLYLNSQPILTKNLSVYPNDFMQVLVSNWYYIFSRWLVSFVRLRHLKFRRLVFRKSATSRYRSMKRAKQKSFYTPNWIYYVKHDYLDIKSFFEVDFFTLSCFCIYDPATFIYHSPRDFKVIRWHIIRLYNWKYIN